MRVQRLATARTRELEAVATRIGAFVPRLESRDRLGRFLRVTVAGETRRNGWPLAEAAAGLRPAWVLGDTVYGNAGALRSWLERQQQAVLLAIRADARWWVWRHRAPRQLPAGAVAAALPAAAWTRRSAGAGRKGARTYDWALVPRARVGADGHHALLVRQHLTTGDRADYVVFTPRRITRPTLVQVAGRRWAIEQAFETSKQDIGLDHDEVRTYAAWYRFMTLTLSAHAFLAALQARQSPRKTGLRPAPRSSR